MKKCYLCNHYLKSIGNYEFRYLSEKVKLCGRCARNTMEYLKKEHIFMTKREYEFQEVK